MADANGKVLPDFSTSKKWPPMLGIFNIKKMATDARSAQCILGKTVSLTYFAYSDVQLFVTWLKKDMIS